MKTMSVTMAVLAVACLPSVADAASQTAMVGGREADFAVTPPRSVSMTKDLAGNAKQSLLDMAGRAKPSVVTGPLPTGFEGKQTP